MKKQAKPTFAEVDYALCVLCDADAETISKAPWATRETVAGRITKAEVIARERGGSPRKGR